MHSVQLRRAALSALAKTYVPEWRFSAEQPDAGSVVACLIDDMFCESEKRLSQAVHMHKIQYLNLFDRLKEEPVESAKCYVRFVQTTGTDQPVHVPKGTRLIAQDAQSGRQLIFETSYGITTTNAQPVFAIATDKASDHIACLMDARQLGSSDKPFVAFDLSGTSEACHRLLLGFDGAFDAMQGVTLGLQIETPDPGGKEAAMRLLASGAVRFSMLEPQGEQAFASVERRGELLWLSLPGYTPQRVTLADKERYVLCLRSSEPMDLKLSSAELVFGEQNCPADEVVCAGVSRSVGRFSPFGEPMEIYAECAMECRSVFARRGADAQMSFLLDFIPISQALPEPQNELDLKIIMKRPVEPPRLEPVEVRANEVLFEYRSDVGWKRLLDDEHTSLLFNGSAQGRITVRFVLPRDMAEEDGQPRLRLRLLRADNLYRLPCVQLCPVITELSFSYRYENRRLLPDYACTENNFETADVTDSIRRQRAFELFYNQEDSSTAMYLGFDQNPQGMPLSLYFEVENDEDVPLHYRIEYLTERGFELLRAVDNTGGLLYSGTLLLPVAPDAVAQTLFDRHAWWLRLVLQEPLPPVPPMVRRILTNMARVENLRSRTEEFFITDTDAPQHFSLGEKNLIAAEVYVNEEDGDSENEENWVRWQRRTGFEQRGRYCDIDLPAGTVRFAKNAFSPFPLKPRAAAVRVVYQSYQGSAANVEADTITTLSESIRYISGATNPMPAYGGYDGYNEQTSALAISNLLRTRGRAVTAQDYFDIISQASFGVRRIKCVSGVNRRGEKDPSAVTVALLIEEFEKGGHIFSAVRDAVRKKLLETSGILPLGRTLYLSQPHFVRVSARVWLVGESGQDPYELQRRTLENIRTYIDPLTGGFEASGWEIGRLPTVRQLMAYLKLRQPGLTISRIVMAAKAGGAEYALDDEIYRHIRNPFVMAVNGEHTVYIDLSGR